MFCDKYSEWGILYLYNELEADEKKRFEAHLFKCEHCQTELAVLKETKELVHSLPQEELDPHACKKLFHIAKKQNKTVSVPWKHLLESLKILLQPKWRLAFVPVAILILTLGIIYIKNPSIVTQTPTLLTDQEFLLDWDSGLEESLDALETEINQFTFQSDISTELAVMDDEQVLISQESYSDEKLAQIEEDIRLLARELNSLNF